MLISQVLFYLFIYFIRKKGNFHPNVIDMVRIFIDIESLSFNPHRKIIYIYFCRFGPHVKKNLVVPLPKAISLSLSACTQ